MTHMRYWAMSLGAAVSGAFLAIDKFAFGAPAARWIAFGVGILATVLCLGALFLALLRENHAFSGLSALASLIAAWTIVETMTFRPSTAAWLAFANGIALLLVALRALALHETTVERIVHKLEPGTEAASAAAGPAVRTALARRFEVSAPMHDWLYWLAQMGLALAGAFIVLMTFALTTPGAHHASPRWVAFGIGIAAVVVAGAALVERAFAGRRRHDADGTPGRRSATLAVSGLAVTVPMAMVATMAVYSGSTARWIAFGLGCGIAAIALVASTIHELTSERVRHELEIAVAEPAREPAGV